MIGVVHSSSPAAVVNLPSKMEFSSRKAHREVTNESKQMVTLHK